MQTLVAEILAAWRHAERLKAELAPGTPDQRMASTASDRLRDLYPELTGPDVAGHGGSDYVRDGGGGRDR